MHDHKAALILRFALLAACWRVLAIHAQTLPLPERPDHASGGRELARLLSTFELRQREEKIAAEVLAGNVPQFLRKLCPVCVTNSSGNATNTATFYVTPDYLAIGSDEDYLLVPLSPGTAQRLADALDCVLPTPRMVNQIYAAAEVKLPPSPIAPSAAMTSMFVFSNHNAIIWNQRAAMLERHPLGALVAGHKKDVVVCARLAQSPGKVAIYGWHHTNGAPIQPLYLGHSAGWVDYSQCIRLVRQQLLVNGNQTTATQVLADPALAGLLSDEGVVAVPRYATNQSEISQAGPTVAPDKLSWTAAAFNEQVTAFTLSPEIKVQLNAPSPLVKGRKTLLIFYALPNGNTTEQTIGRQIKPGEDWHYDIQHIGAQTRFLRHVLTNETVVVAYLEAAQRSWPTWRKTYGDARLPQVIRQVRGFFSDSPLELVLSGHSGGGSFIFGYLNAMDKIPPDVVRIAFLDSTYAYDRERGHEAKLAQWLRASDRNDLCVLAYDDASALLNGKPFVSAAGGTWGRSHAMQRDLAADFAFTSQTNALFEDYAALGGRVRILLRQNPKREVLHTVQVERNGFIHALLLGTPDEGRGYEYFGPRAYEQWIEQR